MSNVVSIIPKKFQFEGAQLDVVTKDGNVWVSVRRVCEALGIAFQPQHAKLPTREWATITNIVTVAEDGKTRELFCISVDSLPMWLATIETNKVAEHVRPKLVAFQRQCADALRRHFMGCGPGSELMDRMLRFHAAKSRRNFWSEEIVGSLCKTYGIQRKAQELPAPLLGVIGWIYRVVLRPEVYAEMKARNPRRPDREMHYEWWTDELKGMLDDDINVIRALSNTSAGKEDFKRRMLAHYRREPYQLKLGIDEAA